MKPPGLRALTRSPAAPRRRCALSAPGVATGDRVLLPEYGGQAVKLNDTECGAATWPRVRSAAARAQLTRRCGALRRFLLFRDEEILGVLKDE